MYYFALTLVLSFYFGTGLVTVCSRITLVLVAFYLKPIHHKFSHGSQLKPNQEKNI